jgi:hypothetical protein
MKKYRLILLSIIMTGIIASTSCKKELDVKNPNYPTIDQAKTESGIIALASGSVYNNSANNGAGGLGDGYFGTVIGYHELLADNIASTIANGNLNNVNVPDYVILDDGTKISNPSPQKMNLRINNARDRIGTNMFYPEWQSMYALNNACNQLLDLVDGISFSGDADTKKNTIKAWAYWWKGFAYARLGSVYYAGIINNVTSSTNPNYVTSAALIAESNKNLQTASAILSSINNTATYMSIMGQLIPSFVQTGNGAVPTQQMFIRNINTLEARNLLANIKLTDMTTANWQTLLTLTSAGIGANDNVFEAVSSDINDIFNANGGCVSSLTAGIPATTLFTVSERLIQEFTPGDLRFSKNFIQNEYLNQVGGFTFSTRWELLNAGDTTVNNNNAIVFCDKTPGNQVVYIAGSYEENELMKAEALINTGKIDLGLASVDNVRNYQGAGLAPVSGTGLSLDAAKEELRRERRVALVFRGTAYYDARRWGVIYDISQGGGRTNAVVLGTDGVLNTKAMINYNFLDYWDVPADEVVLNPPAPGSVPVKNPN